MMKKSVLSVLFSTLIWLSSGTSVPGQQSIRQKDDCAKESRYARWLGYSILSDAVVGGQRNVELLLEQPTFSECALKWIFDKVSRRYAEPEDLLVTVRNRVVEDEKGPWALYHRQSGGEGFQYRPNGSYKGVKQVLLRGIDPFAMKKK